MDIHFTARKFKARDNLKTHAVSELKRLDKFYDGIVRGDIILSYQRSANSLKTAEINLHVHGTILTAKEQSEEFLKSINLAVDKIERQLSKYKTKLQMKDKKTLRRVKEEVAPLDIGDEE
jgi:putative sigma-54 modulation protein